MGSVDRELREVFKDGCFEISSDRLDDAREAVERGETYERVIVVGNKMDSVEDMDTIAAILKSVGATIIW